MKEKLFLLQSWQVYRVRLWHLGCLLVLYLLVRSALLYVEHTISAPQLAAYRHLLVTTPRASVDVESLTYLMLWTQVLETVTGPLALLLIGIIVFSGRWAMQREYWVLVMLLVLKVLVVAGIMWMQR